MNPRPILAGLALATTLTGAAPAPLELGSRLEPLVDRHLFDSLTNVRHVLQAPRDEGPVMRFDEPWEGPFCIYSTVIHDGTRHRLYYRGKGGHTPDGTGEVTCYAESTDGIHWTKPRLGLREVAGSRDNNVILTEPGITHNFSPFLDRRPDVPADERYKALAGLIDHHNPTRGLRAYVSADGIRWRQLHDGPVLTRGAFDSQNVAFWSESEQCYVAYFRIFTAGVTSAEQWAPAGLRSVSRATSRDFRHWSEPERMRFSPPQEYQLYTNQTHPYFRAPHLYVATASRFFKGRPGLTAEEARRIQVDPAYFRTAQDVSDSVLLTSRDGRTYDQTFREALVRPGLALNEWVSRNGYPVLNIVQTGPAEMSLYVNQHYAQPTAHLRRYSLRLDGFAAVQAPFEGGELRTKPLRFTGRRLLLNFATSAAGSLRVELQDEAGHPLPGFAAADCPEIFGNSISRPVRWRDGEDVSALAGRTVRVRFVMKDAELFALQFSP